MSGSVDKEERFSHPVVSNVKVKIPRMMVSGNSDNGAGPPPRGGRAKCGGGVCPLLLVVVVVVVIVAKAGNLGLPLPLLSHTFPSIFCAPPYFSRLLPAVAPFRGCSK